MKKAVLISLFFIIPLIVFGAQFNPYLEQVAAAYEQGAPLVNGGAGLDQQLPVAIPDTVMVWGEGDPGAVQARGGQIINSHYPFFTARIPTDRLAGFKQESAIRYIKGGLKAHNLLDKAIPAVHADQTYNAGYLGDDVIIGVIDDSIDPYHPDFQNENGLSRILYIWDQDQDGNPPTLFNYGHEWTKQDIDNERFSFNSTDFHGTHVTGIAAGNGSWSDGLYRGVSPRANIIMVKTGGYLDQIINGTEYILSQAKKLKKPCVINISMGFHFGNHQADDPFNQYMEQVLEYYGAEGNIIVWAAGNEAQYPIHTTNLTSTTLTTSIEFTNGGTGSLFSFYYRNSSRIPVSLTRIASQQIGSTTTTASGSYADLYYEDYQDDKVIYVVINENSSFRWALNFGTSAQPVEVHGYFENYNPYAGGPWGFTDYVSNGTISVSACMQNSLAVASYVSRSAYTNWNNTYWTPSPLNVGQISDFSSQGPTRDGQKKPEIAAPGQSVISTLSSVAFVDNNWVVVPGKYFAISGTSMAAPIVTGMVAQLLEQDPTLTVDQVRQRLIQYVLPANAYKTDPGTWDPRFGYGLAAVDGILTETTADEVIQISVKNNIFKPSAATDQQLSFLVRSRSADVINESIDVKIYTGRGGLVKEYDPRMISGVGVEEYVWNGEGGNGIPVPAGIYYIVVQVGNNTHRYPVLIVE